MQRKFPEKDKAFFLILSTKIENISKYVFFFPSRVEFRCQLERGIAVFYSPKSATIFKVVFHPKICYDDKRGKNILLFISFINSVFSTNSVFFNY